MPPITCTGLFTCAPGNKLTHTSKIKCKQLHQSFNTFSQYKKELCSNCTKQRRKFDNPYLGLDKLACGNNFRTLKHIFAGAKCNALFTLHKQQQQDWVNVLETKTITTVDWCVGHRKSNKTGLYGGHTHNNNTGLMCKAQTTKSRISWTLRHLTCCKKSTLTVLKVYYIILSAALISCC